VVLEQVQKTALEKKVADLLGLENGLVLTHDPKFVGREERVLRYTTGALPVDNDGHWFNRFVESVEFVVVASGPRRDPLFTQEADVYVNVEHGRLCVSGGDTFYEMDTLFYCPEKGAWFTRDEACGYRKERGLAHSLSF
jgi:hypothetical protein